MPARKTVPTCRRPIQSGGHYAGKNPISRGTSAGKCCGAWQRCDRQYAIDAWPDEPFKRDFSSCALHTVGLADHELAANSHATGNRLRYGEAAVERPTLGHKAGTQQID